MHVRKCLGRPLAAVLLASTAAACSDTADPPPSFVSASRVATSSECPGGGAVVEVGTDANRNGMLDPAEVDESRTQVICNPEDGEPGERGPDGLNALLRTADEVAGVNCGVGGVRVDAGLDDDGNGQLSDGEVDVTTYVCNQPAGRDGNRFLVRTSSATPEQCEQTGFVISSGLDVDASAELEPSEIQFTQIVCAATDGFDRRVELDAEPPGTNCAAGGQRITEGFDASRDGVLQAPEIESISFLCIPVAGLVTTSTVGPGADCANGGLRIERGRDADVDGQLSASEIIETAFVCQTDDGQRGLVRTSTEAAGDNCANGGVRVDTGVDSNGDGSLDVGEVIETSFICDGEPGVDGRAGSAVDLAVEAPGANCPAGGTRVQTGPDNDGNGALDPAEVTSTAYVCNQPDGLFNLVVVTLEPPGIDCFEGGQRVDAGIDDNADGILQTSEIDATRFVCSAVAVVPVAITTPSMLPNVFAGDDLSDITISGVGGLGGGYLWRLDNAPLGVSIAAMGTPATMLSGVLTSTGTFTFDVILTDAGGAVARQTFVLTVAPPPCGPDMNGAVGEDLTPITVPSPNFASNVRGMAADDVDDGWIYYVEPNLGFARFRKNGAEKEEDLQNGLADLPASNIGYEIEFAGSSIYITSDVTAQCTTNCVYRVSNDAGATFTYQDIGDFTTVGAPNDDLRGIHVADGIMYVITHDSATTELYSIDLSVALPAPATLLATFPEIELCSGLDGDGLYLYTVCDDVDNTTDKGVVRINLSTLMAETIWLTPTFFSIGSNIVSSVYGQDLDNDSLYDILYVSGDGGDDLYLCAPSAAPLQPIFGRSWLTSFSGDDEGMAFDRVNRAVYKIDENSVNAAKFD